MLPWKQTTAYIINVLIGDTYIFLKCDMFIYWRKWNLICIATDLAQIILIKSEQTMTKLTMF